MTDGTLGTVVTVLTVAMEVIVVTVMTLVRENLAMKENFEKKEEEKN